MRRLLPQIIVICLVLSITNTASAKLTLSGESIWRLGYGSRYYSTYGWKLGLGGFLASQEIRLDVTGEIIDGLFLEAHIDNTKGDLFQQLVVSLDWRGLWAKGGNISYESANPILGRSRAAIMGISAGFRGENFAVFAIGGISSGSKGSKAFKGATAQESIDYVTGGPYLPSRIESGLQGALEGLWQAATGAEFDPSFDKGGVLFAESSTYGELSDFLDANSLGFLANGTANPDGTLIAGELVNGTGVDGLSGVSGAYIVLKELPQAIIRGILVDLIRQYNENLGLSGDAAAKYPYIAGSQTDTEFLANLLEGWVSFATASKATGEVIASAPFTAFSRGLIYPLGFTDVLADTLTVTAIALTGTQIPLIAVPGANWVCYEDRGYLEMVLPADFTSTYSHIKAAFSYRLAQGLYFLGGGIIRGSLTVKLDGKLLYAGSDYEIDYETGILMLMVTAADGAEGLLEVEYEFAKPGTKAWIAAAGASYSPNNDLKIALEYSYGSDAPYLAEDETTVSRERSYEHLIAAWADWRLADGLKLSAGASFSASVFPGDSSLRDNDYNQIRDIESLEDNAGGIWWAFAHSAGVTVLSPYGGGWSDLRMPGSFAAVPVNSAISSSGTWYFATDAGLALLNADFTGYGEGFADVISLWRSAGTKDGLPSRIISSVGISMGSLFAGTPVGLVQGQLDLEGPWTLYRSTEHPELGDGIITGLAPIASGLLISGGNSIAHYDGLVFEQLLAEGARSMKPALLDSGLSAVAATENGAIVIGPALETERIGSGRQLSSAAGSGGFAFYTSEDGLFAYDLDGETEIALYSGTAMESVGTDGYDIFAGGTADELYSIPIVRLDYPTGEVQTIGQIEHGINGRDRAHYLIKDPSENTVMGAAGYIALGYDSAAFDAEAVLKARGAGSLAGAGPGKADSASASLKLGWKPTGTLSVNFLEILEANKLFSFAREEAPMVLSNTLQAGMGWNGPVALNLLASYIASKGFGDSALPLNQTVSGSANLQYSIGPLRLAGSLSGSYRLAEGFDAYSSAGATAALYLQAGKNTSISLSYAEPRPFGALLAPSGNYRSLAGNIRYSAYMTYGSLVASARGSYKWDVRNIADTADLSASLIYAARQIKLFGASFIPRTELTLSYLMPLGADSRISAYTKLSAGTSIGIFGTDASYWHKLTYMIESGRLTNAGEASITGYLSKAGWKLRPSLQLGAAYTLETPNMGETAGTWKASAKFSLSSAGTVPNQASASYAYSSLRGGRHDIGLSDSFSFSMLEGRLGFGAGINANMGLLPLSISSSSYKAAINANISYKFDKSWSGSLLGEVGLGSSALYDDPKLLYGFELKIALKF